MAAIKVKQNFGLDPRNTKWSNDKDRFGHQYLEKMGWTPGRGLGLVEHATTSHVKVSLKDDNVGLGAKLHKKQRKDEFDLGECAGLDAFQRILGRLNGKEDTITNELERQRKDRVINGKWGMHFVKGAVLGSTWDAENKALKKDPSSFESINDSSKTKQISKKHSRDDSGNNEESSSLKRSKKLKKEKKEKKIEMTEREEKKEKEEKEERKREKHLRRSKTGIDEAQRKEDKKDRKGKKEKKQNKDKKDMKEKKVRIEVDSEKISPLPQGEKAIASRLSVRSKWIKQKRASVMDAKALNEIFMISK